jgi:hypothetical protein
LYVVLELQSREQSYTMLTAALFDFTAQSEEG